MASAPGPLRVGAALSWRLLVVAAAIALVAYLAARLRVVIIPAFVAALITTLLYPLADALRAWRVPRTLASVLAFTAGLLVLVGTAAAILPPVIDDLADVDGLQADVESGIDRARDWLVQGPLQLSAEEVDRYLDRGLAELQANAQRFAGGAVTGALLVVELFAGAALTVVLTFFFVKDGERFWEWFIRLFDRDMQSDVRAVGERVWRMMTGYVRGTLGVAAVDAVFIGLALLLIGVPFVVPLAVLIFIGGLIPIVGAFATGLIAVLVALGTGGLVPALLVLAAIVVVQQLEGNLVAPFLVGRSVNLHPVVVLLAVTVGGVIWGVLGAFVAVPLAAVISATVGYLAGRTSDDELATAVAIEATPTE